MKKFQRRDFLKKVSAATLAGGAGLLVGHELKPTTASGTVEPALNNAVVQSDAASINAKPEKFNNFPALQSDKPIEWKMVTTWPPNFPVFGEGVNLMARQIEEMSGGRLKIQVFGGDELFPPFESFNAVRRGEAEMGHGAAYYWADQIPTAQFFAAVPFGMNAQQMLGWLYAGGGLELWEELYADFNLLPIPAGNTGAQMGGWFNREINSITDFAGLKMRMPGLGGQVIARAGAIPILSPAGELYIELERGLIDAAEWVGPYHDSIMGFQKVAKYYYYPGWHEPGTVLELILNRRAFEKLPPDLQSIIRKAAEFQNTWMLAQFGAQNNLHLQKLTVVDQVQLKRYPDEVLATLRGYAEAVTAQVAATNPLSKKVYDSFSRFQKGVAEWGSVSEKAFYESIQS